MYTWKSAAQRTKNAAPSEQTSTRRAEFLHRLVAQVARARSAELFLFERVTQELGVRWLVFEDESRVTFQGTPISTENEWE